MPVCLVTGGSGFIGSHLITALCMRGDHITNVDVKPPGISHPSQVSYYYEDISQLSKHQLFRDGQDKFDEIYHLAAEPWSKSNPNWLFTSKKIMDSNITGTLKTISTHPADILVFASTANHYGSGRKFKETDPMVIVSPYGYSKAIGEKIISLSGQRYVIYRFGTVVGTRGRCFPNFLVWSVVNGRAETVEIFNNGYTYRDIIDVRDIVSALMSACKLANGIYNVSSGTEIRGPELAETVHEEAVRRGYDGLEHKPTPFIPDGYTPESTLDISKILDTGVWKPRYALKDTISTLFDYYESAKDAPKPPAWDEL